MSNIASKQAKAQAEKMRQDDAAVRELTLDNMELRNQINTRRRAIDANNRRIEGILGYSRPKKKKVQSLA